LLVIHKLKFLLFLCWVWFWIQKRVEFVMSFLFKRHSDYHIVADEMGLKLDFNVEFVTKVKNQGWMMKLQQRLVNNYRRRGRELRLNLEHL
jgi:hypothetical protein